MPPPEPPTKPPTKVWPVAVTGLAIFLTGHIVHASNRSGSSLITIGAAILAIAAIMKLRAPKRRT